jgi:hypothetical protein
VREPREAGQRAPARHARTAAGATLTYPDEEEDH